MFDFLKPAATATENAVAEVVRGFESIPHRLKILGEHIAEAMAHPFTPPGVKIGLPMLLEIVEDLRQEVAEMRKPCPCEKVVQPPAPGVEVDSGVEKAPEVVQPDPVNLSAKWPTRAAAAAAHAAGEMSEAEAAVFVAVCAKLDADPFAAA